MAIDDFARLRAMLACRGAALPRSPDAEALAAIQRCKKCNYVKLCDEFLAAPSSSASRAFCPNTHYIEVRRQRRLAFTS